MQHGLLLSRIDRRAGNLRRVQGSSRLSRAATSQPRLAAWGLALLGALAASLALALAPGFTHAQGEPQDCLRSDDFGGTELDPKWEVVRRDDTRLSVSGGSLDLVSAPFDIFGDQTGLPNIVLQPLPGGGSEPWSITAEMTWAPTQNFQNAGLMIYTDDDNYIKTGMVWNGARNFELIKETAGNPTFPGGSTSAGSVGDTFFLRFISADGNSVDAQFSADGSSWTDIGTTGTDLTGLTNPRIGVYATASNQAGAGQPTASFHSVEIEPDECTAQDTTPPETTAQLNGADPVPTYDDPVEVELSATDPEGGSEPQTHEVAGEGFVWNPDALEIAAGDTVEWDFSGGFHDICLGAEVPGQVTAGECAEGDEQLGDAADGDTGGSRTFTEPGSFAYYCTYHFPSMSGDLEVTEAQGTPGSGVAQTEYSLDGGAPVVSENDADSDPFETAFTVTEPGEHTVEYFSTDEAGNVEATKSVSFEIEDGGGGECPSDEFDGTELDPKWEVVRRDDERLSVAGGALNLVSAPMDIFAAETGLQNIVVQPLPGAATEPWSITTRMTWAPTQNFQNAGLIVYSDDANYIKTGMVWNGGQVADGRNFELIKETNNNATFPGNSNPPDGFPNTFFLRITSADGQSLVAQYSADGTTWTNIGATGTNLSGIANPRIGVYATASTQAGVSEPTASYDWVRITPEDCPDGIPPTTTHAFDPASPNGQNGWYTSPVTTTLTATDNEGGSGVASTEYALDGGATQDYSGPFQLSTDGEHEIEYFSTDNEGNAETPKSAQLMIDQAAPMTTAELDGAPPVPSYDGPVTATLFAADPTSGVASTEYALDGGAFQEYAGPFTVSGVGPHEIELFSSDDAGNVEETQSVSFEIEEAGEPELRLQVSPGRERVRVGQTAAFTATVRNLGEAATSNLRVCVRAPRSKLRVVGKECVRSGALDPGERMAPRFRLKPKRSARGKSVKATFTATAAGLGTERDTATVKVRR
jgi:plastocyanin/regulation of enolase protein 1 (concanavalin A-like superfamily)